MVRKGPLLLKDRSGEEEEEAMRSQLERNLQASEGGEAMVDQAPEELLPLLPHHCRCL